MIRQPGDDSPLLDQQLAAGLRGDFTTGLRLAQELAKQFPDNHRAAFNRAWYLMMQGELLKGFECLSRGRWCNVFGDPPLQTPQPIYLNQDLQGKYLLYRCEGGLGDEIINIRFIKDFAERGAKVVVACSGGLASVFARIHGVSAVVEREVAAGVYHDYWVPAMSAGHILKKEFSDLDGRPYITSHPAYREKWKKILNDRYGNRMPRIGVRFYGNPKFEHEQHRRFPAEGLIKALGGRPFVNLQKEETDLPLDTWEDTLALLEYLDLVITSCTSVAHAAAALGKETWVISPVLPYYIWALPGEKSPWYNSVTLIRQAKFGEWSNVFKEVSEKLDHREVGEKLSRL